MVAAMALTERRRAAATAAVMAANERRAASAARDDPQSLQLLMRGGPVISVNSTTARQLSVVAATSAFVVAVQWRTVAHHVSALQPLAWHAATYYC